MDAMWSIKNVQFLAHAVAAHHQRVCTVNSC